MTELHILQVEYKIKHLDAELVPNVGIIQWH